MAHRGSGGKECNAGTFFESEEVGILDSTKTKLKTANPHAVVPRSTKTEESGANPVPVIPILRKALEAHRKLNRASGYIFAGERRGAPSNLDNLSRRVLSPILKDGWKDWHGFRRGLATNLYRLGVPPKVIQDILRHAYVSTTQTHYIVVDRTETKAAMKKLEAAIGKEWAKARRLGSSNVLKNKVRARNSAG